MNNISKSLLLAGLSAGWWFSVAQATLIGQWRFNEPVGATAIDTSGNGNNGTLLNGATRAAAPGYLAASLDGTDDYVSMGAPATFDLTSTVSLEVWVNPTSNVGGSGEKLLLGKQFGNYALSLYHNGNAYFYWDGGANNANAPVSVGVWTHLVGTYDGAAVRLYTNGVLASSLGYVDTTAVSGDPLIVGGPGTSFTGYLHGLVDQAAIYDHALSPGEVLANFNAGANAFATVPEPSVAALLLVAGAMIWRRMRK